MGLDVLGSSHGMAVPRRSVIRVFSLDLLVDSTCEGRTNCSSHDDQNQKTKVTDP